MEASRLACYVSSSAVAFLEAITEETERPSLDRAGRGGSQMTGQTCGLCFTGIRDIQDNRGDTSPSYAWYNGL